MSSVREEFNSSFQNRTRSGLVVQSGHFAETCMVKREAAQARNAGHDRTKAPSSLVDLSHLITESIVSSRDISIESRDWGYRSVAGASSSEPYNLNPTKSERLSCRFALMATTSTSIFCKVFPYERGQIYISHG